MKFNDHPEKFFPYMQANITVFPKGKLNDLDNFIEVPAIYGPVDAIIDKVLGYFKTIIIKEAVSKVPGKKEAKRFFNYPYEAFEEIICNAFYHRDYREHEPVDIVIEPDFISVSNVGGPDRAVKMGDFESGTPKPRRYRNRRLGDFLKSSTSLKENPLASPPYAPNSRATAHPLPSTNSMKKEPGFARR